MSAETSHPAAVMAQLITNSLYISRALYVAAQLGIADLLAQEPRTSAALAEAAGAHAPSLFRLLRALASIGVFAEDEQGRFGLTPLGETLRSDIPGSLRAMALFNTAPWHTHVWDSLLHGVQTGEPPIVHATGMSVFEYFLSHPEHSALFDQAMTSLSGMEAAAVLAGYDFAGIDRLVDIGGGHGLLLGSILQAHPSMRGVLYDLPPVADGARQLLDRLGVLERCAIVAGDFFETVRAGADAYILKNIVHDFDDDRALMILTNCRRAMGDRARLLLAQEVLPDGNAPESGKLLDLQMLLIGGRERTETEYRSLLSASGFALSRIVPLPAPLHVIEATPFS
jgi:O-methyltransferase/methyltransferase family protein